MYNGDIIEMVRAGVLATTTHELPAKEALAVSQYISGSKVVDAPRT